MTIRRWKEVEPILTTLLKDEVPVGSERSRRYDPDDLRQWWNNGQIASRHETLHKHLIYTEGNGLQVSLPGFYRPRLVVCPTKHSWSAQYRRNSTIPAVATPSTRKKY
jgi:hypothetical protein